MSEFYIYSARDPHKTGRPHASCKRCQHDARARNRRANPAAAAATARRHKLKSKFGITPEDYAQILQAQNGVCAICERESPDGRRLHVDHCHKSNTVRGLLCHDCNRGLGMFKDDAARLLRAATYLHAPTVLQNPKTHS